MFSCVESVARVEKFHSEPGENYLDFSVIWPNLAKTLSSRLKLACHSRAILALGLPCPIPHKRIVGEEILCLAKLSSWDFLLILLLLPQGGFFYFRNPCHILFHGPFHSCYSARNQKTLRIITVNTLKVQDLTLIKCFIAKFL